VTASHQRPRLGPAAATAVLVGGLLSAACGGGATSSAGSGGPRLAGSLTVFAAASLTDAFKDAEITLEREHPGFRATYSFAGSQQLVSNIENGAPADVIATADTTTMQRLVAAGLVDAPRTLAHNLLEIAVATGNPKRIQTLGDLARPDVSVVLADPGVPAGRLARQALASAGVSVTPKSNELDVRAALQKVESGDADAAIVYRTDVLAAAGRVDGVTIPQAQSVIAEYAIAVVRAAPNHQAAAAFVELAATGAVQAALQRRGFLPP